MVTSLGGWDLPLSALLPLSFSGLPGPTLQVGPFPGGGQFHSPSRSRRARVFLGEAEWRKGGCPGLAVFFDLSLEYSGASLIAQLVKNLPAIQETPV